MPHLAGASDAARRRLAYDTRGWQAVARRAVWFGVGNGRKILASSK